MLDGYDPEMIGAAYAVAAACCLLAWRQNRSQLHPETRARGSLVWMIAGILLGVMAIARATGAANVGADAVRELVRTTPWYDDRRPLQLMALVALVALWVFASVLVIRQIRHRPPSLLPLMVAGVATALVALDAIRAVSLHAADNVLSRSTLFTVEVGDVLEVALLATIVALSIPSLTAGPTRPPPSSPRPPRTTPDHTTLADREME